MRGNFDHTGRLARFILRRERVNSAVWLILLISFSVGLAPVLGNMFDETARKALIDTVNNPAMIAMMGPVYGMDNYTVGALFSNMMLQWTLITIAIMNILLVVRHTRADEESGRAEVVRSLPTGRLATLSATMLVAVVVNLILAVLTGVGIAVCNIESMSFNGAMLYGAALGVIGLFFAAVAAVMAQLSQSSRGATGFSFAVLSGAYLFRAAGDMQSEALALISPMGMIQRAQIFVENKWWPVFAVLAITAVVGLIAYVLNRVRDIDQGFVPARPGRRTASVFLQTSGGLSFRLLRTSLLVWVVGIFSFAAAYGTVLGDIDSFVQSSEFYSMVIGSNPNFSIAEMFVSMVTSIMALFGMVPVLMTVLKIRNEEQSGRFEHILSRAVSRGSYLAGFVVMAVVTSVLMQCATAVGIYVVSVSMLPDSTTLTLAYLFKATLVYLPAIWVVMGIAILLIGLLPKFSNGIVWAYFGLAAFASFIGRIPGILPDWLIKLTPFGYVPQLPVDSINYTTLVLLTVVAAALSTVGFLSYKKRDLAV